MSASDVIKITNTGAASDEYSSEYHSCFSFPPESNCLIKTIGNIRPGEYGDWEAWILRNKGIRWQGDYRTSLGRTGTGEDFWTIFQPYRAEKGFRFPSFVNRVPKLLSVLLLWMRGLESMGIVKHRHRGHRNCGIYFREQESGNMGIIRTRTWGHRN